MQVASFSPNWQALLDQPLISDALASWQKAARAELPELRFPSRRDEAWRYVPHRRVPKLKPYAEPSQVKPRYDHPSLEWDVYRLQCIDGVLISSDVIKGVRITPLSKCDEEQSRFVAHELSEKDAWIRLNQACLTHGFLIEVDAGIKVEKPLVIIDHTTSQVAKQCLNARYVIKLGEDASFDVIMHQSSDSDVLVNTVSVIDLGQRARFSSLRIQQMHSEALCFHQQEVIQGDCSEAHLGQFLLGASVSRDAVHVVLQGTEARVELSGTAFPRTGQFANIYSHLTHGVPHTSAKQQYRSIVHDKAQSVFYGRVHVLPNAQKTASYQHNANLLLGQRAQANSKPELEIYADDVICSHGSTTGQLADDQLFYLRSRGIPENQASALLVDGFAGVTTDPWKDSPAYDFLSDAIALRGKEE